MAYAGGTTKLYDHLESKHPSSVAESSGKEAGKKQLTLSDCKKCPPERAKNIIAHVAEYTPNFYRRWRIIARVGGFQQLLHYIVLYYIQLCFLVSICKLVIGVQTYRRIFGYSFVKACEYPEP